MSGRGSNKVSQVKKSQSAEGGDELWARRAKGSSREAT